MTEETTGRSPERDPVRYDTILLSDVHLGSPLSRAAALTAFLRNIRVENLILAGDIFDDLNFHRLRRSHWEALGQIRKVSDHCRVVWVRGNHDVVSAATLSHLLGISVVNSYAWRSHGRLCFAIHGDRWDTFIYRFQRLTALLTAFYNALSRLNAGWARAFTRVLKNKAKLLTRNSDAVRKGAVAFARKNGYDAVFCGHTHFPLLARDGDLVYGNSGTWQSDVPHFIGVAADRVDLCRYVDNAATVAASLPLDNGR